MNKIFNVKDYENTSAENRMLVLPVFVEPHDNNGEGMTVRIEEKNGKAVVITESKSGSCMYITLKELTYILRKEIASAMAMRHFTEIADRVPESERTIKTYVR